MEVYRIKVVDLNKKTENLICVEVEEAEETDNFVFCAEIHGRMITVSDEFYFSAYQKFRDELLNAGLGIKCAGSALNAVQSQMMGTTDKVYLVKIGEQALLKDMVCMWDYYETDYFPDTEQQHLFFEKWSVSLGRK